MTRHLDKRRFAAVCGECCIRCAPVLAGACRGCAYELGSTPRGECAVFHCAVVVHGIEHCGLCPDFPCDTFRAAAGNPRRLQQRIAALERRRQIGTELWIDEHIAGCGED